MVRTATLIAVSAASIYLFCKLKQRTKDLEGVFWSRVPPSISNFIRTNYITARGLQIFFNSVAKVIIFFQLLFTQPNLLQKHMYPPHRVVADVFYADRSNSYRQRHQCLDVYSPKNIISTTTTPVFIFIHGGIWTLFSKDFFRLLGEQFAERGTCCVIPSYSYYPDGGINEQIEDVSSAIKWVQKNISKYGGSMNKIILCGQSSGAHITSQYVLRHSDSIGSLAGYIGLSGVYNPLDHNLKFERQRGVNHISPLVPANGGLLRWNGYDENEENEEPMKQYSSCSFVQKLAKSSLMRLPPILIIHGKKDTTVPTSSSQEFYDHCRTAIDSIDEEEEEEKEEEEEEEEKKKKKKKKKKKNLSGGQKKIEIQFLSEMDHSSYLADISFLKKGEENLLLNNIMNFVQDVVGGGAGDICQVEWSNSNNEVIELIHVVDSVMKKCPWAKTKTANQLLSYTVSELEEIKEAIDNRGVDGGKEEETSSDDLESEVGDLLFDAILLARTCERDFSNCSLNRMFSRVTGKIRRRCPHVFAGEMCTSPEEAGMIWQREKLKEKSMVMVKSNGKKTED